MACHDSKSEEDLKIARILDERSSKNATKSTKTALKAFVKAAGDVFSKLKLLFLNYKRQTLLSRKTCSCLPFNILALFKFSV